MSSDALEALIAAKRANPYSSDRSIEELRIETEARIDANPMPPGATYTSVTGRGVPMEWIQMPGVAEDRVFYFIHGGGYYRGTVATSRSPAAELSAVCGARTLSVDYRLAPEHPFPAAVDDVVAGYLWLLEQGIDAKRIVVGGISAGGGLTVALLLALKKSGDPLPAGAVPLSPWLDLTQGGTSFRSKAAEDPIISKAYLDRMAGYYLAGQDPNHPLASPLFGDLKGLPPLLIQVGTAETLLDDSTAFARRAKEAGVDVRLEEWEGLVHGWHGFPQLPETRQAMARIGEFFKQVMT
jgi:acetyl esterase/lipase